VPRYAPFAAAVAEACDEPARLFKELRVVSEQAKAIAHEMAVMAGRAAAEAATVEGVVAIGFNKAQLAALVETADRAEAAAKVEGVTDPEVVARRRTDAVAKAVREARSLHGVYVQWLTSEQRAAAKHAADEAEQAAIGCGADSADEIAEARAAAVSAVVAASRTLCGVGVGWLTAVQRAAAEGDADDAAAILPTGASAEDVEAARKEAVEKAVAAVRRANGEHKRSFFFSVAAPLALPPAAALFAGSPGRLCSPLPRPYTTPPPPPPPPSSLSRAPQHSQGGR
jgi:hypothetical protein